MGLFSLMSIDDKLGKTRELGTKTRITSGMKNDPLPQQIEPLLLACKN
jgi:hypothetical protein